MGGFQGNVFEGPHDPLALHRPRPRRRNRDLRRVHRRAVRARRLLGPWHRPAVTGGLSGPMTTSLASTRMHPWREQLPERGSFYRRADMPGARSFGESMSTDCTEVWDDY